MLDILNMDKKDLLALWPADVTRRLEKEEILHIFSLLDGLWQYDYAAAQKGRSGCHAELKSERHSDGFLNSREVLRYYNICRLMARQIFWKWLSLDLPLPSRIAGIPKGATALGEHLAHLMRVKTADLEKVDGKIKLTEDLKPNEELLLVEDFITAGTGFVEARKNIVYECPSATLLPFIPVIINRGGLEKIETDYGAFRIISLTDHRMNDWDKEECFLCHNYGSIPMKPKQSRENWDILKESQKK